ncbi:MAG: MurR/RpiR family transcriptional regulator [Desulfobacterales bacterium]|jgi:DNA-binding MurR/RpiR family transcriptional regulator
MGPILDKIYTEYKAFTPSQQKVAAYLTQHLDEALILNANQLAKKAGVSEATFTRFITRLGFSGFSEFKREIGNFVIQGHSTTERLAESAETFGISDSVFLEILRGDIENIHKITNGISNELFEKAVEKLSSAKSIYLLGLRSSYALAFYLAFNLRFFLKSVTLIKPGIGDIPEQVLSAGKDDVLLAVSFRRFTRDVVNIVEKIKRKKAYIIAITNSHLSPIAQLADMSLAVETEIPTYIESFTAPMSLLNAFITAVALKKKKQALPALTKLETEFDEFEIYYSRDLGLNKRK